MSQEEQSPNSGDDSRHRRHQRRRPSNGGFRDSRRDPSDPNSGLDTRPADESSREDTQRRSDPEPRREDRPARNDQERRRDGRQERKTDGNNRDRHGSDSIDKDLSARNRDTQSQRHGRPHHRDDHRNEIPMVSVVIPLLNEEESLRELSELLEKELQQSTRGRYEVIFIDDGSTDGSWEVIRNINRRNRRFRGLKFRRNCGKSAALNVAFKEAKGDFVITMDADLQDDPAEIPQLLSKLREGYDLVSGWKRKRHDPLEKRIPSKFFNWVTSTVSGIKLHDFNCGLKGYKRDVVKTVQVYGEMHRYIPALAYWEGFRVTEISVQHHARKYGYSKFGLSRYLKGFLDLLTVYFTTRFIKRPLHLFGGMGSLIATIGLGVDSYLVVRKILWNSNFSDHTPMLLFGIALIIVGVQLLSMGLLGELMVKNSLEQHQYTISERLS